MGRRKWIGCRAQEQVGRNLQPAPGGEGAAVAHVARNPQERNRVEVEHRLGLRVIALTHVVACETQDVAHAERRGAENVALHGDAVAIAAGDLANRRMPVCGQNSRRGGARHMAIAAGAVCDVHCVDEPGEFPGAVEQRGWIGRIRRRNLDRRHECARTGTPVRMRAFRARAAAGRKAPAAESRLR